MSGYLWKYYIEDDVESFRQLLESSSFAARPGGSKSHGSQVALGVGSPGSLGTSPTITIKSRKRDDHLAGTPGAPSNITLTRADVNRRDTLGRTLLHLAASSSSENAFAFALALLSQPLTDIYLQDLESGWTALHRAFYFGNISIAQAILHRDAQDTLGSATGGFLSHSLGLIKIKDREGNGPLDLFTSTVDTDRHSMAAIHSGSGDNQSDDEDDRQAEMPQSADDPTSGRVVQALNLQGDEVFTFGSNRNVTLGFGDEDDRQFPERITLKRPEHLLHRFHSEHLEHEARFNTAIEGALNTLQGAQTQGVQPLSSLPAIIRNRPICIQDVLMAKFNTAVLTTDPESNLYMCGHGQGGRLGTGDERTRFQFVCIEGGALAGKHVAAVALGQNHTVAISSDGDVFSWGNNGFGQLGYALPKSGGSDEDPVQLLPRQIFGTLKRETVVGVAASRIHSVAHTSTSLFTFGKNEGQLGIVDSDARSLESQVIPRKVAASLFSANIASVAAIDRATICLLETHEVYVFANYGYAKISFNLDSFMSHFARQSFTATSYETTPNQICKITAGGNTICAMSTTGEVYTITVSQPSELGQNVSASTTNPAKIRGALSQAHRIWDLRKGHMAARDVDVDQDGSIILTTDEGSVWRRVKRAKIQPSNSNGQYRSKDYKYSRIAGLTRAVAVRASAFGAYAAVRRDCHVTRYQIEVDPQSLWADTLQLFPLNELVGFKDDTDTDISDVQILDNLRRCILGNQDVEGAVNDILETTSTSDLPCNIKFRASTSNIALPVHQFMLTGRSRVARTALSRVEEHGEHFISDILSVKDDEHGVKTLVFQGVDFLTVLNLVLYLYTDVIVDFWLHARHHPNLAFRYRTIRTELLKVATSLELLDLERAARLQVLPTRTMHANFETAFSDPMFFADGDISIQLADANLLVHSAIVCRRCPFFEGLFIGRAGGRWLQREPESGADKQIVQVDLKHVDSSVFAMVLRHIYADTGAALFDTVQADSLDQFLDIVIEVMSVANELMLDRLSQICQAVVGRYVTVRNVCQLLNAIAPCSVTEFKDKALEYICLNLEALLAQGLLNDLDEDLLFELDDVVRSVQLRCSEITRSGAIESALFEAHPELGALVEAEKLAKIDYMMMQSRHFSADRTGSLSVDPFKDRHDGPITRSPRTKAKAHLSPGMLPRSPHLGKKASVGDFMFEMDDDGDEVPPLSLRRDSLPRHPPRALSASHVPRTPTLDEEQWYDNRGKKIASSGQSVSPSVRKTPTGSPAVPAASPRMKAVDGSSPWGRSPSMAKLEMKDIMAQASTSRASGLSIALSGQSPNRPSNDASAIGSFQAKQSQKERKKMQQQSMQSKSAPEIPLVSSSPSSQSLPRASPWQTVQRPKLPLKELSKTPSPAPSPTPAVIRNVTAPAMTMRQTVSGAGASAKQKATEPASSPRPDLSGPWPSPPAPDSRRAATSYFGKAPAVTSQQSPSTAGRPDPPSATKTPSTPVQAIQSIRHTPLPREDPVVGLSMADILSQQQAEKIAIHEAATAKRSLQEIQQEQEFQQWWDLESRRVMEEEEQRKVAQVGRAARGGGSGIRGKGRKARGNHADHSTKKPGEPALAAGSGNTAPTESASGRTEQSSRRGGHRARGRGK